MTIDPRQGEPDFRPILVPLLVAFALGLVVVPFSAIGAFWVWVCSTAIAVTVGEVRIHAAERERLAKLPAPLPEAKLLQPHTDTTTATPDRRP